MIPPAYALASISSHIPNFVSTNRDEQKAAKAQWWEECETMQNALEATARKVFDAQTARKYIMSGTDCFTLCLWHQCTPG